MTVQSCFIALALIDISCDDTTKRLDPKLASIRLEQMNCFNVGDDDEDDDDDNDDDDDGGNGNDDDGNSKVGDAKEGRNNGNLLQKQ